MIEDTEPVMIIPTHHLLHTNKVTIGTTPLMQVGVVVTITMVVASMVTVTMAAVLEDMVDEELQNHPSTTAIILSPRIVSQIVSFYK